jgi:hypothetical protein
MKILILATALLIGCATGYNPKNAHINAQDQIRKSTPYLSCPAGTVAFCDIEGGGIVGKTYGNCRCGRR